MEIFTIISGIISLILGSSTILTYFLFRKQEKQLKVLEVEQVKIASDNSKYEMYEQRISHLNDLQEIHNQTFHKQAEMIDDLNDRLLSKTDQIRKLTDELLKSEYQQNELNLKLNDKIEENGKLQLKLQYLKNWVCIKADCPMREPESPTIKGQKFEEP